MEAVIIVNWKYSAASPGYLDLSNAEKDGEIMGKILKEGGYESITLIENAADVETEVKAIIDNQETPIERFHLHFSGKPYCFQSYICME